MKKLQALTAIAFFLTLVYGTTIYRSYVPPFKEGACIEMDARYLGGGVPTPDSQPFMVFGSIAKNSLPDAMSTVVMVYEVMPNVYMSSVEYVMFVELRDSKAKEVPCD